MFVRSVVFLLCSFKLAHGAAISNNSEFELSIIHLNDFHARFEEIDRHALTCSNKNDNCLGGFSRMYSTIHKLKEEHPYSIVLNAGDNFQGTLWYTIYKWKAVQYFMNKIPFDAHTLGNHEFDDGIEGCLPYLKNLKSPIVVANIDDSEEPTIKGLFKKSIIVERPGLRIGIIGVIVSNAKEITNSGKLKFLDESESVNKEAERLVKEDNVDTIIVLSHSGYEMEQKIAKYAAPKISLIVGGHSHTLLYTGTPPNKFVAAGPYPTVVEHSDGRKVLVVQASSYTKFLGNISVKYNNNGDVVSWSGAPIYLNNSLPQDPKINLEIAEWKKTVDEYGNTILGKTEVFLDGTSCGKTECNLGNFITDAMIHSVSSINEKSTKMYLPIAFMNSGGIRTSLPIGDITISRLLECQPFHDTFDFAEIQGKYIKKALEYSARLLVPTKEPALSFVQVSGIRVVYNVTNEVGSRVQSLKVFCTDCPVPSYEDIDMNRFYTLISNSYIMSGQDGFKVIPQNMINFKVGEIDSDALIKFLKLHNPVVQTIEGRIVIVQ